ncbi:pseudoazurin [Swaminathania salitolerans]|uniref:Pseudoazurin n=1 Tax=Swaminathania salitolerans TaxID=182838 RepID=A0A511BQQ2_9PROT|nr:pseudoazurin [Swaminathania salitolerans]GBQ11926.1 pseudoazurin [Swaminathania salitolerans LMG 21291]GEL02671.1 pseudoazurin [Swaminathania salitolerans]
MRHTIMRHALSASLFLASLVAAGAASPANAATVDVRMLSHTKEGGRGFDPAVVHIHSGDTVHFIAADPGHNVQSIPGMIPEGAQGFSGRIGHDLNVTFTKPGLYGYKCLPHYFLGMVGLVEVDNADNEAKLKAVSQPGAAKARFAKLFDDVDHH